MCTPRLANSSFGDGVGQECMKRSSRKRCMAIYTSSPGCSCVRADGGGLVRYKIPRFKCDFLLCDFEAIYPPWPGCSCYRGLGGGQTYNRRHERLELPVFLGVCAMVKAQEDTRITISRVAQKKVRTK